MPVPSRTIRDPDRELRIAIADDSGLIYSDDYRAGWEKGFSSLLGVVTKSFDVAPIRGMSTRTLGAYRSRGAPGTPKLLAESIVRWEPDLVFCHHGRAASHSAFLSKLKKHGIRTAVYLCDEPYETGETARYSPSFDYAFTMDPATVEAHTVSRQDRADAVFYLPPAVDVDRFKWKPYRERSVPALFLGNASLTPRPTYLKLIEKLIPGVKILYWKTVGKGRDGWIPLSDHPALYSSCIVGLNVHRLPWINEKCWRTRVKGRHPALRVPSGIQLPHERPPEWGTGFWNDGNLPAAHINPRFLEMAACGTLVVNDNARSELARMFPMAPQASDPEHFYELVRYYLDHVKEAEDIGRACSSRISSRHTYRHRAAEVLLRTGLRGQELGDLWSCLGAPVEWLTPQLSELQKVNSSSERIGHSERWSPAFGHASIATSGSPSEATSIDAPPLW